MKRTKVGTFNLESGGIVISSSTSQLGHEQQVVLEGVRKGRWGGEITRHAHYLCDNVKDKVVDNLYAFWVGLKGREDLEWEYVKTLDMLNINPSNIGVFDKSIYMYHMNPKLFGDEIQWHTYNYTKDPRFYVSCEEVLKEKDAGSMEGKFILFEKGQTRQWATIGGVLSRCSVTYPNIFVARKNGEIVGVKINIVHHAFRMDTEEAVLEAVQEGDVSYLAYLHENKKLHVNEKLCDDIPLHVATQLGRMETVQFLLENGAKVDVKNEYKMTPLFYALSDGNVPLAKLLIENGASLKAKDESGRTAAIFAYKNLEAVCFVLENEDRMFKKDVETMKKVKEELMEKELFYAIQSGDCELAEKLIAMGANISKKDEQGRDALHNAVRAWQPKIIKLLLKNGADIHSKNAYGNTAFTEANNSRRLACVRAFSGYEEKLTREELVILSKALAS